MSDLQEVCEKVRGFIGEKAGNVWASNDAVYIEKDGLNHVVFVRGGELPTQESVDAILPREATEDAPVVTEKDEVTTSSRRKKSKTVAADEVEATTGDC